MARRGPTTQHHSTTRRTGERGASALEFALVAPLLIAALLAVFDFGRLAATAAAVHASAREAARYGSVVGTTATGIPRYADCDGMRAAATDNIVAGLARPQVDITYDTGPGTLPLFACPESGAILPSLVGPGVRIVVATGRSFRFVLPVLSDIAGDVQVTSTAARTIPGRPAGAP